MVTRRAAASAAGSHTARQEATFWARMGEVWEGWEPVHLYGLSMIDPHLMRLAALREGDRVLDVGCGVGEPSLWIAGFVGPKGSVVGIDVAPSMIEVAKRRARSRRVRNVAFQVADVQRFRRRGRPFDAAVSRYALMFAEDTDAALANLHAALRRGGRLAIAVWGRERDNAGFTVRIEAARPFAKAGEPACGLPKRGLSPLRYADPALLLRSMRAAGFSRVRAEYVRVGAVHQSPEAFARFTVSSSMLELYEELTPANRKRLVDRLAKGISRYAKGSVVRVPGAAWVIVARRG